MTTLLEKGRQGRKLPFPLIDIHGHIGRVDFAIPDLSLRTLVRTMDRMGVAKIAVSHMRCMSADAEFGNARVLEAMKAFPGRILGYVSLWPSDPETVANAATRWLDCGFIGFKFHDTNGFSYADDAYRPAYEAANRRRMPMLFHTWGQEAEFGSLREIARAYPETSILLGHAGCENIDAYVELARSAPNIYLELCLSRTPRGRIERFVQDVGADRVVWGTDALFKSATQGLGMVLGARISENDMRRVLSDNAGDILSRVRADPAT